MPPFVPRKRRSPSPEAPPAKRRETARGKKAPVDQKPTNPTKPKSSVFDAIDTLNTKATAEEAKNFFASVGKGDSDDEDDGDGSSSEDDDEFEDVPMKEAPKEQDDGEDMDWEDAIPATETNVDDDSAIQDINISINEDGSVAAVAAAEQQAKAKKGPSKRERQARIRAHCIHVQTLLFHNAVRNSWLNDKELHKILLDSLSQGVKDEIDRWKINMGMKQPPPKKKQKGKSKGNSKARDWGQDADRLEPGVPNLSAGDPLLRLLKVLTAYWRKRFQITAPGIRKQGHLPQRLITYEIKAWAKNKSNFERHGERIENIDEFRKLAKECRGSRDVGAQLFTALIRAIGIESRMIASLQPAGFGWTKFDEGEIKRQPQTTSTNPVEISDDESLVESPKPKSKSKAKKPIKAEKPARKSTRKSKSAAVEEESSELSSLLSDAEDDDDDDASVIDITPAPPPKNSKKYDRDLAYPHYWTEVLSPVSNTYIPVDSIVLSTVASNQDLLSTFEPRGKRADQARQVICYVIAHNVDTTCKDVTVRYLKKHQLPGRTKGFRMPVEKIPVLNKRGKVIKTEDYDFFKRIMSPFVRPQNKRTAADDVEESTDLKPFKPAAEKAKVATESLQWYKQSAEFVLERHLRREEAILPEAKQVRTFTSGKGDKEKSEPVYRRADVVNCKTVESWHKEGRQIKVGEQPLKMVPVRAVTLMRKREMEEAERETGEKLKQGLYGIDQTEWIIPPPIENGVIPKNAYNNIDVYVPSMVPKGAVHIPLRSTARICRKLNIDYAEACTGFEFGKQRAVPVITGVVVAAENEDAVIDAWEVEEAERKRKEDVKRQATNLHLWRKFLMGLRIVERIRSDYAGRPNEIDEVNPFVNRDKQKKKKAPRDEMTEGGGFLVDEDEEDDKLTETKDEEDTELSLGGGFIPEDEDEDNTKEEDADIEMGGGFLLDDDEDAEEEKKPVTSSHFAPMSLASAAHRQTLSSDAEPVKDEEESDEEMEIDEAPPQRRNSRATAKSKAKPKAAPKAKAKPAQKAAPKRAARKSKATIASSEEASASASGSADEDAESSLSDFTDASEDDAPAPKIKRRYSSPRVVISPRKKNGTIKKEVKSPYFSHTEDDGGGEEMDEDDVEEEESEEEVVKPRGTTRRTRGRG